MRSVAAAVAGRVYAIGGRHGTTNQVVATVQAYDPATDTWTQVLPMPTARLFLAAAARRRSQAAGVSVMSASRSRP